MTLAQFKYELSQMLSHTETGCGNHGCSILSPKGQGTNGNCCCRPKDFKRRLNSLVERLPDYQFLQS